MLIFFQGFSWVLVKCLRDCGCLPSQDLPLSREGEALGSGESEDCEDKREPCSAVPAGSWGLFPALLFQGPLKTISKEPEADDSRYKICVILRYRPLNESVRLVVTAKEMDIK